MTTRVEHMLALKAAWENAPAGPQREAALKNYEAAKKANASRSDLQARHHLGAAAVAVK
jgi:hypothetical protein